MLCCAPPGSRTLNLRIKSPAPTSPPSAAQSAEQGFRPDRSLGSAAESAAVRGVCRQECRQTSTGKAGDGLTFAKPAVRHGRAARMRAERRGFLYVGRSPEASNELGIEEMTRSLVDVV